MESFLKHVAFEGRKFCQNIYFLGDCHLGSVMCDEEKLDSDIARIARDPNAIVFLMGDLVDAITPKDRRFEDGLVAPWVERGDILGSQMRRTFQKFGRLGDKVVGLVDGNHEDKISRDFSLYIKRELITLAEMKGHKWADLSYSALARLNFDWKTGVPGRRSDSNQQGSPLTIFLHHGYGGGRTMAEANHFRDWMRDYDADWYISGHTHRCYSTNSAYMLMNKGGALVERRRLYGRSGTYLRTVAVGAAASYSEKKGYGLLPRGCLCIRYYPARAVDQWVQESAA